jgi:hypothetical protein
MIGSLSLVIDSSGKVSVRRRHARRLQKKGYADCSTDKCRCRTSSNPLKFTGLWNTSAAPAAIARLRRLPWSDYGYVSRRWIGFERCYGVITSTGGHAEIHDDQIGTGRSCLLYGLKPGRCFNRFVAGFPEAEQQQFSNGGIVIDDENLAFDRFGTVTHGPHFKNLSILINQFRWPAFLVVPPLISFCGIELDRRAESGTRGLI